MKFAETLKRSERLSERFYFHGKGNSFKNKQNAVKGGVAACGTLYGVKRHTSAAELPAGAAGSCHTASVGDQRATPFGRFTMKRNLREDIGTPRGDYDLQKELNCVLSMLSEERKIEYDNQKKKEQEKFKEFYSHEDDWDLGR